MGHHEQQPDPELTSLQELRRTVADAGEDLGAALRTPAARMADGSTWNGPTTAPRFAGDLGGRSDELPRLFGSILDAIDAEIVQRQPRQPRQTHQGGAHG